jgi:hypothetical protein
MDCERVSSQNSLLDVLDRVLDKGVVIDAWVRVSLVGIDLVTLKARVVVASIETYLRHSATPADARIAGRPGGGAQTRPPSLAETLGLTRHVPAPCSIASPPAPIPMHGTSLRARTPPRMNT